MDDLISISMKNVNRRSIFSEIIIVNFYDALPKQYAKSFLPTIGSSPA
jgi:hypothetical protein